MPAIRFQIKARVLAVFFPLTSRLGKIITIILKSLHTPTHPPLPPASVVSPQPPAVSSNWTKSVTWAEFLTHHQKCYDEWVQKETMAAAGTTWMLA